MMDITIQKRTQPLDRKVSINERSFRELSFSGIYHSQILVAFHDFQDIASGQREGVVNGKLEKILVLKDSSYIIIRYLKAPTTYSTILAQYG